MKQTVFWLSALLLVLTSGTIGGAQIPPPPTPTPDPHTYTDPGMNFTAPANAYLVGRATNATPDALSEDLQTVATWVLDPGQEDARTISLAMEAYDGPPEQWEAQFESQTHSSQDGTLIRNKTPMTLLNGMPAYFVEIAYGSGFDAKKEYAVVWADGQRGVVLAEVSRLGDSSDEEARRVLKQVTAVRYPMNQP
jgi:hypothetical protein